MHEYLREAVATLPSGARGGGGARVEVRGRRAGPPDRQARKMHARLRDALERWDRGEHSA